MKHLLIAALKQTVLQADFKTVTRKYIDQGVNEIDILRSLKDFKNLRDSNRIKDTVKKNIDFWGERSFEDLRTFVEKLKNQKSKTQVRKQKKKEGAERRGENELWDVYKILTYEASCYYGSGTNWCVTSKNDSDDWDWYNHVVDFYYLISKTKGKKDPLYKIAMVVDKDTVNFLDAEDNDIKLPKDIETELPQFKVDKIKPWTFSIEGKKYTEEEFYKADGLKVKKDLDLSNMPIFDLPQNMVVGGDFDVSRTRIEKLPENLDVGGIIFISHIETENIPNHLRHKIDRRF